MPYRRKFRPKRRKRTFHRSILYGPPTRGRHLSYFRKQFVGRVGPKPILKRYNYATNLTNITDTAQFFVWNYIAKGNGPNAERTERKIYAKSAKFKGLFYWDTGGTPATVLRVIVADVKSDFDGTSVSIAANIYDRDSFQGVFGHIYKDFRIIRHSSDVINTRLRFSIYPRRHYYYEGDAADDYRVAAYNKLVVIFVTDNAAATSDLLFCHGTFRYYG